MRKAFIISAFLISNLYCFSQPDKILLPVCVENKWGYVNNGGQLVVTPTYDYTDEFSNGLAKVKKNDKIGIVNSKGVEIIPPVYEETSIYLVTAKGIPYSKLILHKTNEKWGCSDSAGNKVLENLYNAIYFDDLILVKTDSIAGFYYPVFFNARKEPKIAEVKVSYVTKSGGYFIFKSSDNKEGVFDAKGNVVIQPVYDKISAAGGRLFYATLQSKVGIISDQQEVKIEIKYDLISPFKNHLAQIKSGEKYGLINDQFNTLLEPVYNTITAYEDKVKAKKNTDLTVLDIDTLGNLLEKNDYTNVKTIFIENAYSKKTDFFSNSSLIDTTYVSEEWFLDDSLKKWGLLSDSGDTLIQPTFKKVYSNRNNNYALVEILRRDTVILPYDVLPVESVQGILDPATGKALVPIRYFNICLSDFLDTSVAIVRCLNSAGVWGYLKKIPKYEFHKVVYIGKSGENIYRVLKEGKLTSNISKYKKGFYISSLYELYKTFTRNPFWYSYTGESLYCIEGKWSYLKEDSLYTPEYEFAGNFKNKRAIVMQGGKWGVINDNLDSVISCKYDSIAILANSGDSLFKLYLKNQKMGLMNKSGKIITDMIYDDIGDFSEGFCFAKKNSMYGFLNREGKEITEFKFSKVSDFSNEMAAVKVGSKWGYIDTNGTMVIEPSFKKAEDFSDEMAYVSIKNGTGYINKSGELVFDIKCTKALKYINGVAWIKNGGSYGLIDKSGKWVIKPKFDDVQPFSEKGELTIARSKSKYGIVNNKGETISPIKFTNIEKLSKSGFAIFQRNGKYGFMDENGQIAINADYDLVNDFYNGYAIVRKNDQYLIMKEDGTPATCFIKSDCVLKISTKDNEAGNSSGARFSANEISEATSADCILVVDTTNNTQYFLKTSKEDYSRYFLEKENEMEQDTSDESISIIKKTNLFAIQDRSINYYNLLEPAGENLLKYRQNMVYGIADLDGNLIFKPRFENISYCGNNIYKVVYHNLICYLKKDGTWIWKPYE